MGGGAGIALNPAAIPQQCKRRSRLRLCLEDRSWGFGATGFCLPLWFRRWRDAHHLGHPTRRCYRLPWPDARYGYDPSLIREDATTLLELDAPLIAQLQVSDAVQNLSTERRT